MALKAKLCYVPGAMTAPMTASPPPSRFARVCRFLLLVLLCAFGTAFGQANLPLYLNTLENAFQNWSWIPNNFADASHAPPGFTRSISATANGDWQAISLGCNVVNAYQGLNLAPYQNLVFWMNGGAVGGQKIQVFTGDFNGSPLGVAYSLPALPTNTWTQFTIPLSTICPPGTTNINRFTFQLTPYGGTNTWYLGDIYLSARPAPGVTLSVDVTQTIRAADPRWFGVNTAIYDGNLDTPSTSDALAQAGLLSLRFPGGSESDDYNWSTSRTGTNTFTWGTSFVNFAHIATNAGAQVFTTVNYGTGSSNEAAAWVAYANGSSTNTLALGTDQYGTNWQTVGYWASLRAALPIRNDDGHNFLRISHPAPFGFKYWEIGNECYGTWETDSNTPPWSAHTYATRYAGYNALMKAVDPTIKIGAVATTGEDSSANYTTYAATNSVTGLVHYGWTPVMLGTLKNLGVTPDFLIYHYYPEYSPQGDSDQLVLQVSSQLAGDAPNLRAMLTDYLGASSTNTELCITENNGETDGRQSTSLVNGLYVADTMGVVMKTEFNAYTFWDLRNGQDTSGDYDSTIYGWRTVGDNGCMFGQTTFYPTYFGLSMMQYLARPGSTILNASSTYPLLTPYAARAADGSLRLLVINKDTSAVFTGHVSLANFTPLSSATAYSYGQPQDTAAENNFNLSAQQIAVTNLSSVTSSFLYFFPPLSLTVFNFAPAAPSLSPLPAASGQFVFQLNGQFQTPYVLQSSSDLVHWTPVSTNLLAGSTMNVTNPVSPGNVAQFWRAVWVP